MMMESDPLCAVCMLGYMLELVAPIKHTILPAIYQVVGSSVAEQLKK